MIDRILHPSRWLIWSIVMVVIAMILLWWAVEVFFIRQYAKINSQRIAYVTRVYERSQEVRVEKEQVFTKTIKNWREYKNSDHRFEIHFPEEWFSKTIQYADGADIVYFSSNNLAYESPIKLRTLELPDAVTLTIEKNNEKLSLSDLARKYISTDLGQDRVSIGNISALRITQNIAVGARVMVILMSPGDEEIFTFSTLMADLSNFETMISTFQFIK